MIRINLVPYPQLAKLLGVYVVAKDVDELRYIFKDIFKEEDFRDFLEHAYKNQHIIIQATPGVVDPLTTSADAFKIDSPYIKTPKYNGPDWSKMTDMNARLSPLLESTRKQLQQSDPDRLFKLAMLDALHRIESQLSMLHSTRNDTVDQINQGVDELRQELIDKGYLL